MTAPSSLNGEPQDSAASSPSETEDSPVSIPIEKPPTAQAGKPQRIPLKTPISPIKKGLILIIISCIIYTLAGFFLAPLVITSLLSSTLEKKMNRPVTIGSAQVNPFRFDIILKNGIIGAEKDNPEDTIDPLFSFGRLKIKLQPQAIFTSKTAMQAVHGNSLFLHLVRDQNHELNIQSLLNTAKPFSLNTISDKLKQIDLKVTDGEILFDDKESETTHTIKQIRLRLPAEKTTEITRSFSAEINGSPIKFSASPKGNTTDKQDFVLHLKEINLPSYLNYLPAPFPQLISKGTADLDINITTQQTAEDFILSASGTGLARDIWVNDGKENHNKIQSASFSFSSNSLDKKIIFHKLVLEKPELHVNKDKDGQFFFPAKNTFTRQTGTQELEIESLVIENGQLIFIDKHVPGGFGVSFNTINLSIDKTNDGVSNSYALNCTTDRKTKIASQGTITRESWQLQGLFILKDLPASALNSYFTKPDGINITSGLVNKLETSFMLSPLSPHLLTNLNEATLNINDLSLSYQGKEILTLPTCKLTRGHYSHKKRIASLGHVEGQDGHFHLTPTSPFPIPTFQAENKQLLWSIDQLSMQNCLTHLRDFQLQDKPQTIAIKDLNATNISADPNKKATIETTIALLQSATYHGQGTVQFNPFRGTLASKLRQVSLTNIPAPLLRWFVPTLLGGSLAAQGQFTFPDLSFTGTTNIRKLKLRYGDHHELFTVGNIDIPEGTFSLSAPQVQLKQIQIKEMRTGLAISKKEILRVADFFTPRSETEASLLFNIDKIIFNNSSFILHDHTSKPPFAYAISQTNGTIIGINSQGTAPTHLDLTGTGTKQTSFKLSGTTQLFTDTFGADLKASIKNFPINAIKPFIEPITGYGLQGGLFDLDVNYHEEGGLMSSETSLDIRSLSLTSEVKGNKHFPDIVALLTDPGGHIHQDISFNGSTTDPSYTFQSAYAKRLQELTLATMVSPYSALSAYFTDKGKVPNQIIFIPGSHELAPNQKNNLISLQTILKNRPLLHVTLAGFSGSTEDRKILLKKKQQQKDKKEQQQALLAGSNIAQGYGKEFQSHPLTNKDPIGSFTKKVQLTKQELKDLATQRSKSIKQLLIEEYAINGDILHIDTTPTVVPESDTGIQGHRIDFILSGKAP